MRSLREYAGLRLNRVLHRLHTMPLLVLMPHSSCNCRCIMCDIWRANKQREEISAAQIERHVASFRALGVRHVLLSGGEALMHSNLWRLCEALRTLDARITLLSTGLLLGKHAQAIAANVDEVIVSLDGSRETHNRIRNLPRAYEKLEAGVAALRDVSAAVDLSARCVLQRENHDDFFGIVEAARSLHLDSISFLAADVSSEAFNRPGGWDDTRSSSIALQAGECDVLDALIDRAELELAGDFESGFIREDAPRLRRIVTYYRALLGRAEFPPQRCNAPWVSAVIESDGQVRPCFFHAAYGSIGETDFARVVNSDDAIRFRRSLDVNKNPVCRRCVCTINI